MLGNKRLHDDKYAKQGTNHNLCPPGGQSSLKADKGQDNALNQHTEQSSRNEANAAGQKSAANNGGSNSIHFHAHAVQIIACQHHQGISNATQGGTEAADGINAYLGAEHRQSHQGSRGLAAAQSVNIAAKSCEAQHHCCYNQGSKGNQHPHGHEARTHRQAEIRHSHKNRIGNIDGLPGNHCRHTAAEQHACQSDDEGLQIKLGDDVALQGSEQGSHQQHDENRCKDRNAGIGQNPRQHHAGQCQYRTY